MNELDRWLNDLDISALEQAVLHLREAKMLLAAAGHGSEHIKHLEAMAKEIGNETSAALLSRQPDEVGGRA